MKHLIIIGARGFGREVYHSALDSLGYGTEFDIKGYLDDKVDALSQYEGYPPIIGPVETYQPLENDVFVCALGDVKWKEHYVQLICEKGGEFISLIHRNAYVSKTAKYGIGCIILEGARLQSDTIIGDFVTLQPYSILGHDTCVGDMCQIGCYAFTGGGVVIGNNVSLNTRGTILPHIKVGSNVTIGAGSVVIRKVLEGKTVFGNPAEELDF